MKSLIAQNNEKRKLLNKENKKIYEDMLMYVRLSYQKSGAETEEVLMELLDHLLILQGEGRDASELFGDDPKKYANEIVGELPQTITKKLLMLFFMGVCYFLGVATFINGLISTIVYYGFGRLESFETYYIGSLSINTLLSLVIAFLVVYGCLRYIRWSCFKNVSKTFEFLFAGLFLGALPFGIFLGLFYFVPSFGPAITLEVYWLMLVGVGFFILARVFQKKA
ncbi:Protein of unknown function [Gracilibacillus orientalis]|uniref:DNA-binding ferritin-like protein (Dps family) n=1 Tax=Gracilibacillus orientalis TaxID=334253 RepID=A0A1I4LR00_9BACI|nr:DUF1129 family protein [Gracilibacillus orientalis]SFL93434.1 Protein of unknown function [Gracilibacillus orientalis]